MSKYETMYAAIDNLVCEPICGHGETTSDFDIDEIAEQTIEQDLDGYYVSSVSVDTFWRIVEQNRVER